MEEGEIKAKLVAYTSGNIAINARISIFYSDRMILFLSSVPDLDFFLPEAKYEINSSCYAVNFFFLLL